MTDNSDSQMLLEFDNPCICELDDLDPYCLTCSPVNHLQPGSEVELGSWYSWGDGKFAGRTVLVDTVHDHRAATGDSHALMFMCRLPDGGIDFPVAPHDMELS